MDLHQVIEQIAIEAVCPLSGKPVTVFEINMVKVFTEFGMRVAWKLAPEISVGLSDKPAE